jgi:hypothetical protein
MRLKFISFSNLTLFVALSLSTVAAYYSIIGLTAIFAGAVIPIIVMGSILEVGKITTTVWLRKYWHRASWTIKLYLVPAVILLAFLTSMGIFGFLSKAHTDQSLVGGDVQAKIAVYDEKIKTAKDNIDANRKSLKQMDEAVDQVMARSSSETGADKAVSIRRAQQKERARIQSEIQAEQKTISALSEERAPIAAEVRKVEAEVGPIKYIAAFIYGDDPDTNLLEAAVRWVIILIVIVFDPLAIALVLAANASKEWDKEEPEPVKEAYYEKDDGPLTDDQVSQIKETALKPMRFVDHGEHPKDYDEKQIEEVKVETILPEPDPIKKPEAESSILEKHPYLLTGFSHFKNITPMVHKPVLEIKEPVVEEPVKEEPVVEEPTIGTAEIDASSSSEPIIEVTPTDIETDGVTKVNPVKDIEGGYVLYDGKNFKKDALREMHPELFKISVDGPNNISTNFGTTFPKISSKGDMFVRVDVLPNRVYKFDGRRWIEVNKEVTDSYLHDQEYIKYLIGKIGKGEYDVDLLSDNEKAEISQYLTNRNN